MGAPPFVPSDIVLTRTVDEPIYRQIYAGFRAAILDGRYARGTRLPSIRSLAEDLDVSRNTVEAAYGLLAGEGLLDGREKSRASVAATATLVASALARHAPAGRPPPAASAFRQGIHPLHPAIPALDAFPAAAWYRLNQRVLLDRNTITMLGGDPRGYRPLRAAIATHLMVARGVHCSEENIFITNGFRQSLVHLATALLTPGDSVALEDPHHPPVRALLHRLGARIEPCPIDEHGLSVDTVRAGKARLAVVTPAGHYPTGAVLSLDRRYALLQWARDTDAVILEDDYGSDFCQRERRQPPLMALDSSGHTLLVGTFGFTVHPSVRTAFVAVPDRLIETIGASLDPLHDNGVPPVHKVLTAFIDEGHYGQHLKKMRALYRKRRQFLESAIHDACCPGLVVASQGEGPALLAQLESKQCDVTIAGRAGLPSEALSLRYLDGARRRGFVLGYANCPNETIARESISRLVVAIRAQAALT